MKRAVGLWFRMMLVALSILAGTAVISEAAQITGTVTNNSGKPGRVFIQANWSPPFGGQTGIGVTVQPTGSPLQAGFTLSGLSAGTYDLFVWLDTTGTGQRHANDPFATVTNITVSSGAASAGAITLNAVTDAITSGTVTMNGFLPTVTGNATAITFNHPRGVRTGDPLSSQTSNQPIIADSYEVACSVNSVARPTITASATDDFPPFITGLTAGDNVNCTVTPTIFGSPRPASAASISGSITAATLGGLATVTGTVNFVNGTPGTGTLLVVLHDDSDAQPAIWVKTNPSASETYSIPNVATGRLYKAYALFDRNSSGTKDGGDLINDERLPPRLTVENLAGTVTAAPITLNFSQKSFKWLNISHQVDNRASTSQFNRESIGRQFEFRDNICQVVNVTLKPGTNSVFSENITVGADWGRFSYNYWGGTTPRLDGSETYLADIEHVGSGCTTDANQSLAPFVLVADLPKPTFPIGQINFDADKTVSWQTPNPLPGLYYAYGAFDGYNWNDPRLLPTVQAATIGSLNAGSGFWTGMMQIIFGDSIQVLSDYTVPGGGPAITNVSPLTGPFGTAVTITGSGFSGASPAVSFNGTPASVTVDSDTQIRTTVPNNAHTGPVLVTAGGITTTSGINLVFTPTVGANISLTKFGTTTPQITTAKVHVIGQNPATDSTYNSGNTRHEIASSVIPSNLPVLLKITDSGYLPHYSAFSKFSANTTTPSSQFSLLDATTLNGWGLTNVTGGSKALINGRITDTTAANIGGAVVHAYSWTNKGQEYEVRYANTTDQAPKTGLAGTDINGGSRFYVIDVEPGDYVTLTADKSGFAFPERIFTLQQGGSVGQSGFTGAAVQTNFAITPAAGSYETPLTVSMAPNSPATIFYTINGTNPADYGTACSTSPCTVTLTHPDVSGSTQYLFRYALRAANGVFTNQGQASYTVTPDLTPPNVTASPASGVFGSFPVAVTLTSNEPATIYYTTNGNTPTTSSPSLSIATYGGSAGPISVSAPGTVLKFFGIDTAPAMNTSSTVSETYRGTTTTTVTTSGTPSTYGTSVTFTAAVSGAGATPTGTVNFYDGGSCITPGPQLGASQGLDVSGQASVSTATLNVAAHSVIACYGGDNTYGPSSGSVAQTVTKATPTASITNTPVTYTGTAQTATVTCLGGGAATLASGGTGTNAGSYPATVNCAASTNYNAAAGLTPTNDPFVINKATPTASITNTPVTYNGAAQTATVACLGGGTATLASGGTGTNAGSYPATVDCATSTNYNAAAGLTPTTGPFVIAKATPTLSVTNSPVTYDGTAKSATVSASVAGNVSNTLTGGTANQTTAGTYAVTANFAPTDAINYNSLTAGAAGNFVINQATPTASITNTPVTYNAAVQTATAACLGGGSATLASGGTGTNAGSYPATINCAASTNYTAAAGLTPTNGPFVINQATPTASITNTPVTYSSSAQTATVACQGGGSATLASGGTGTNAGSYPATVNCAASTNYTAATGLTPANGPFVINQATPTASITNTPATYSGAVQTATVACLGGGTATLASGGTGTNAGSYPATVNCAASTNYTAATSLTPTNGSFVINKATPTASITNTPVTYTGAVQTATLACLGGGSATLASGGTGTNAASYPATVNCAASTNYNAVAGLTPTNGTFVINKATPTLSVTNSPVVYDGTAKSATVSASVPGTVSNVLTGGAASQTAVATYPVTASFVPTDSTNYNSLTNASAGNFLIIAPTQTATVSNSPVTYTGSAQAATVACSGGAASNIRYNGSATVPTNAATYAILVDCAASGNYNATSNVSAGNFVISKATPTLTITNSPATYDGTAKAATVTCSSGGATSNILTGGAAGQTNAGTYAVTANCATTTNYLALTAATAGNFTINKATPLVTWINPANISYGTQLVGTQLNATASITTTSVAGTFSYTPSAGTILQPGMQTLTANFTPADTANYNTPAAKTAQLRVLNPTGDLNNDSKLDLADVLLALKMSVGVTATQLALPTGFMNRGDVGPFDGVDNSTPNGVIDSGDAIIMLRKIVNLVNWI